ncbi:hypothetical protein [Methylobacterium sp. sgz302541]|uniref:hypothetical protein n=1 Tax=unclassified Methylobacterium TaxID=2615210 RepID=UPI003D335050
MSHKFKVGQRVRRARVGYAEGKSAVGDICQVLRLMPDDGTGEPSYRIRSDGAGGERAVREGELVAAG